VVYVHWLSDLLEYKIGLKIKRFPAMDPSKRLCNGIIYIFLKFKLLLHLDSTPLESLLEPLCLHPSIGFITV